MRTNKQTMKEKKYTAVAFHIGHYNMSVIRHSISSLAACLSPSSSTHHPGWTPQKALLLLQKTIKRAGTFFFSQVFTVLISLFASQVISHFFLPHSFYASFPHPQTVTYRPTYIRIIHTHTLSFRHCHPPTKMYPSRAIPTPYSRPVYHLTPALPLL